VCRRAQLQTSATNIDLVIFGIIVMLLPPDHYLSIGRWCKSGTADADGMAVLVRLALLLPGWLYVHLHCRCPVRRWRRFSPWKDLQGSIAATCMSSVQWTLRPLVA